MYPSWNHEKGHYGSRPHPSGLLLLLKGSFLVLVAATALVAELATWEYLSIAGVSGFRRALVMVSIAVLSPQPSAVPPSSCLRSAFAVFS